jgi:hypothetical protein
MIITSEIILNNLLLLETAKRDFPILQVYEDESNDEKLKTLFNEGRYYGLSNYMNFIDYIRYTNKLGQEVFYSKKISIKDFKSTLEKNAIDVKVKSIIKSKGKVSFTKFINSRRWELYSGNIRRRGGYRYQDNFIASSAIIANFCIQNSIDVEDFTKISNWYHNSLPKVDPTLKKEIELTNSLVDYLFKVIGDNNIDFKKINSDNIKNFISFKIESKMKEITEGESVRLIDGVDYHNGLSFDKVYNVITKHITSGRLMISVKNDSGYERSYPYRIFETVSNLRNSALDELLNLE